MSLWDDYKDEHNVNEYNNRIDEDTQWRTQDGRVLEIVDMGTSHLANTIKMCEKHCIYIPKLMIEELNRRVSS